MSWLSKATGIHWGNIGAPLGAAIGSVIPGIGTAIGAELGGAIGGLSGHKNNLAGNLIDLGAGFGGAIPGVGGLLTGGLQKIGNVITDIPGVGGAANWIGNELGTMGGNVLPKVAGTIAGGTTTGSGANSPAPSQSWTPTTQTAPGVSTINPDSAIGQAISQAESPATAPPQSNAILGNIGQLFTDPKTGQFSIAKALQMGLSVGQALEAANAAKRAGQLQSQGNALTDQAVNTVYHPSPLTGMGAGVNNPTNAIAAQAQALQQIIQAQKAAAANR